ncbi:MAG: PEP-utilizing enzyme [Candidatus Parcubacteria bacterium]|nr:PEP-utilizing enzyme [Candidatus Parcubacteria bacterium]
MYISDQQLEGMIANLINLFTKWGIKQNDWILSNKFVNKKYLNELNTSLEARILLKEYCIPWKTNQNESVLPPKDSEFLKEYLDYINNNLYIEIQGINKKSFFNYLKFSEKVQLKNGLCFLQLAPLFYTKTFGRKFFITKSRAKKTQKFGSYRGLLNLKEKLFLYAEFVKDKEILLELEKFQESRNQNIGEFFKGTIINNLNVKGRVKLIFEHEKGMPMKMDINKEDILVMNYATISLLPLIVKAGGIITQTGSFSSHAAIICREFQIPCIIGVKDILLELFNDDIVEINFNLGGVKLIKPTQIDFKEIIKGLK